MCCRVKAKENMLELIDAQRSRGELGEPHVNYAGEAARANDR